MSPDAPTRYEAAIAAIDAANAADPNTLMVRGESQPKELAHARLASEWVERLDPDASEALRLAARAHHVRRWEIPRSEFPKTRPGYLRWRRALQDLHARHAEALLSEVGYEPERIERVVDIIHKRGLGRDAEVQTFEDALCLTFMETQLAAFAEEHPSEKATSVLAKTVRKMSPEARALARTLPLPDAPRAALHQVLDDAGA
ncbi:MAG: DUF4202 domain-containing protein [Myxococcota bacterium]|nr:DUF4202 domain-containing protein [Myxococcota bacterium]